MKPGFDIDGVPGVGFLFQNTLFHWNCMHIGIRESLGVWFGEAMSCTQEGNVQSRMIDGYARLTEDYENLRRTVQQFI